MHRSAHIALAAAASVFAAGLLAGPARAALFLVFSKTTVEPGEVVTVRTGGSGALAELQRSGHQRTRPLRVFIALKAGSNTIRSVRDRRLLPTGRLFVDRKGNGHLRFTVPNLRPGEYTTFLHCVACARYSSGRALLEAGPWGRPFRIKPALRGCGDTQYGRLRSDWRSHAVHAGPLSLYPMPSPASDPVPGRPGYFRPVKVLAILVPGSKATLVVPASERPYVGLAYGHRGPFGRWSAAMRVADALTAVTFQSCSGADYPAEHYGGGFVVSRPMCAELEVHVGRRAPIPLRVPFGRAC